MKRFMIRIMRWKPRKYDDKEREIVVLHEKIEIPKGSIVIIAVIIGLLINLSLIHILYYK